MGSDRGELSCVVRSSLKPVELVPAERYALDDGRRYEVIDPDFGVGIAIGVESASELLKDFLARGQIGIRVLKLEHVEVFRSDAASGALETTIGWSESLSIVEAKLPAEFELPVFGDQGDPLVADRFFVVKIVGVPDADITVEWAIATGVSARPRNKVRLQAAGTTVRSETDSWHTEGWTTVTNKNTLSGRLRVVAPGKVVGPGANAARSGGEFSVARVVGSGAALITYQVSAARIIRRP